MNFDRDETVLSLTSSTRVFRSVFGIRLIEGYFSNVSKFSSMNLYVKILYGDQIWKSPSSEKLGSRPKWNSFHQFEFSQCQTFDLLVYDKSLLFSDTELGRARILLSEVSQGHQTEWWTIQNSSTTIGRILLTIDLPNEDCYIIPNHSCHSSLEIRDDFFKSDFQSDKDLSQSVLFLRNKSRNKSGSQEENLEKLRVDSLNDSGRMNDHELRILYEQAKKEDFKIKKTKAQLRKFKETLKIREQTLNTEENYLKLEKLKLNKEQEEILAMKSQLRHDSAKLKQEKQKLNSDKRDIEGLTQELGCASKRIMKEKMLIKKNTGSLRVEREDDLQSWNSGKKIGFAGVKVLSVMESK